MNRLEMDFNDAPCNADYLSLLPKSARLDIFGENTSGAQSDVSQGLTQYIHYAREAENLLNNALTTSTGDMQPYYQAGTSGMNALAGLLGIPGAPQTYNPMQYLQNVPGYQWGMGQGLNALNSSTNAQGLYGSGPQRQAAIQYGQNYATPYYNTMMQQLAGLGNMGQGAGQQMGNWTQSTASQEVPIELGIGSNYQGAMNTMAGLNLQNQQMNNQGLGSDIGMGLSLLAAPLTGGTSLLGMGLSGLGNMLGPLLSGAGGGGGMALGGGLDTMMAGQGGLGALASLPFFAM